jgi:hypothetical protein
MSLTFLQYSLFSFSSPNIFTRNFSFQTRVALFNNSALNTVKSYINFLILSVLEGISEQCLPFCGVKSLNIERQKFFCGVN